MTTSTPVINIQKHRRRQLLLASCTIAFALLTSTFLQTQLHSSNNNNSTFNTNNNVTSASCGRWIDSQRPSYRRDQEEGVAGSVIITAAELSSGANDENDNNKNNNSGNEGMSDKITATDLTHLSYDSSCLSDEGHHILGARYLEERRRSIAVEEEGGEDQSSRRKLDGESLNGDELLLTIHNDGSQEESPFGEDSDGQYLRGGSMGDTSSNNAEDNNSRRDGENRAAQSSIHKTKMMSPKKMMLRTTASADINHRHDDTSTHRDLTINNYEEEDGWTSHRGEIAPPSDTNSDAQLLQQHIMDYVNGQHVEEEGINMNTASAGAGNELHETEEEEESSEALYQRMQEVMKVTQSIHREFGGTPPPSTTTTDVNNNNNNNTTTDNMVQYSHTSKHSRQRLLTGSYATWQWYDRSNLASPINLNLEKVSRVNYAFFQSDTEGYIFGTDSWADPNILNGDRKSVV